MKTKEVRRKLIGLKAADQVGVIAKLFYGKKISPEQYTKLLSGYNNRCILRIMKTRIVRQMRTCNADFLDKFEEIVKILDAVQEKYDLKS